MASTARGRSRPMPPTKPKSKPGTTKSTRNTGKPWTASDVDQMRQLLTENTPTRVIGLKLGRTEGSIRSQAARQGMSLKPTNQPRRSRRSR